MRAPIRVRKRTGLQREYLILIDGRNRAIGREEKWTVHQRGLLHRAFSVFLVDSAGRVLLQRRSAKKYHSAGLWANSCCGHPRPGERTAVAARRRVREELGADASVHYQFRAQYRTALPNGLIENEVVYVFFGAAPKRFAPNPAEVASLDWKTMPQLLADIDARPRRYAYWLRYYMKNHYAALRAAVREIGSAAALGSIGKAAGGGGAPKDGFFVSQSLRHA